MLEIWPLNSNVCSMVPDLYSDCNCTWHPRMTCDWQSRNFLPLKSLSRSADFSRQKCHSVWLKSSVGCFLVCDFNLHTFFWGGGGFKTRIREIFSSSFIVYGQYEMRKCTDVKWSTGVNFLTTSSPHSLSFPLWHWGPPPSQRPTKWPCQEARKTMPLVEVVKLCNKFLNKKLWAKCRNLEPRFTSRVPTEANSEQQTSMDMTPGLRSTSRAFKLSILSCQQQQPESYFQAANNSSLNLPFWLPTTATWTFLSGCQQQQPEPSFLAANNSSLNLPFRLPTTAAWTFLSG